LRLGEVDPYEALNGLSAALVLVAVGNLAFPHWIDPVSGLAAWQFQVSLWGGSALFVMFGASLSITAIAGLGRDARIWLLVAGIGVTTAMALGHLALNGSARSPVEAIWLVTAVLIVLSVAIDPQPGPTPAAAVTIAGRATIFGAMIVLICGVAVLTLDDLALDDSRMPAAYALAGVFGAMARVAGLVHDLSALSQSRHEALTDELTGIANRRALLAAIDRALLNATSTTLLIVDLDRFKAINDRYGHDVGDQVLRNMAGAFQALMPENALLARLGGDEFAVLLIDAEEEAPTELARRLARAAAPLSDVKGRLLQFGASVGVATVATRGVLGGELLRQADAAMYLAKTSGLGVGRYDSAVDALAQERLELVEDLHRALAGSQLDREQIVVYFQPQLATATGRVTGAEALVRWQHPRRGLLAPDTFIELAEQNELMGALTDRVLREAAHQALRWRATGHPLRVSVNLSASGLGSDSLLLLIDEVLATGLMAEDLVLEVTETSLMKDPESALAAMRRITACGVGISIDDYGTGYSSLSYLNDLPAIELKIDRSFTARITSDPRTVAIVAATVDLAHRLGLRLVAEGVEDEAALTEMARLGCDETQGYLHSRPLAPEPFLAWLTRVDERPPAAVEQATSARG
jgi:diguanylate cyclase (GGDEF)-like protein